MMIQPSQTSPAQPTTISVIVCAYTEQRWDDLGAAVASLQQQTLPPSEIIVVIDHNPSLLARAQAALQGVMVVANSASQGLSGARNTGLSYAHGTIIAFMDEDAFAAPDWLAQLAQAYNDPQVLGVGGAIIPAWQTGRPAWFPAEFDWVVGCTYQGMPQQAAPVRNLIGCNMSFRREVFAAVGGFTTGIGRIGSLPVGCEETELCIRLAQQQPGSVLIYQPQAQVRHRVPAARASWRYFRSRCYHEGRSKAQIARLVGSQAGLAAERSYTMRTLPLGVWRGLTALFQGDRHGLQRALAIGAGLLITTVGYVRGKLTLAGSRTAQPANTPVPKGSA